MHASMCAVTSHNAKRSARPHMGDSPTCLGRRPHNVGSRALRAICRMGRRAEITRTRLAGTAPPMSARAGDTEPAAVGRRVVASLHKRQQRVAALSGRLAEATSCRRDSAPAHVNKGIGDPRWGDMVVGHHVGCTTGTRMFVLGPLGCRKHQAATPRH